MEAPPCADKGTPMKPSLSNRFLVSGLQFGYNLVRPQFIGRGGLDGEEERIADRRRRPRVLKNKDQHKRRIGPVDKLNPVILFISRLASFSTVLLLIAQRKLSSLLPRKEFVRWTARADRAVQQCEAKDWFL